MQIERIYWQACGTTALSWKSLRENSSFGVSLCTRGHTSKGRGYPGALLDARFFLQLENWCLLEEMATACFSQEEGNLFGSPPIQDSPFCFFYFCLPEIIKHTYWHA